MSKGQYGRAASHSILQLSKSPEIPTDVNRPSFSIPMIFRNYVIGCERRMIRSELFSVRGYRANKLKPRREHKSEATSRPAVRTNRFDTLQILMSNISWLTQCPKTLFLEGEIPKEIADGATLTLFG